MRFKAKYERRSPPCQTWLCAEASPSLHSDVLRRSAGEPVDSLSSALEEQLSYARDCDSLTTSPSTSSLDTCSSHRIDEAHPGHQEKSVAPEERGGGQRSSTCCPEMEACSAEKSKIPRSVTDGELKQRIPNVLGQHGVSSVQFPSLPPWNDSLSGESGIFPACFGLTESLQLWRI